MLTKPLEDVFHIRRPRSATLGDYPEGPIPYLGNSFGSNPIAKYVAPFEGDRVFGFDAVVVSAFGEADGSDPTLHRIWGGGNEFGGLGTTNPHEPH